MTKPTENLKSVMNYFGITNSELAKALAVDPSLVSRWLNGQRRLGASSISMNALAEYILSLSRFVEDIEWLKAQFERDGLPTDLSTVYHLKQNLIWWLASDGEALQRNLGRMSSPPGEKKSANIKKAIHCYTGSDNRVGIGYLKIALRLAPLFSGLPDESSVDIFLSDDEVGTVVSEDFSRLHLHKNEKKHLRMRLLVCVSGNTRMWRGPVGCRRLLHYPFRIYPLFKHRLQFLSTDSRRHYSVPRR